jgi:hypothetical protein
MIETQSVEREPYRSLNRIPSRVKGILKPEIQNKSLDREQFSS